MLQHELLRGDLIRELEPQEVDPRGQFSSRFRPTPPPRPVLPCRLTPVRELPHAATLRVVDGQSHRTGARERVLEARLVAEWIGSGGAQADRSRWRRCVIRHLYRRATGADVALGGAVVRKPEPR